MTNAQSGSTRRSVESVKASFSFEFWKRLHFCIVSLCIKRSRYQGSKQVIADARKPVGGLAALKTSQSEVLK